MAKLRSTSRTRSRTPSPPRHETMSTTRPMEETTIGKAYTSPFLALLARIDGEVARLNTTPLHGFFMPPYQLKEENTTVSSPLREIGNYLSPTKSAKKPFIATRGRIAPTPVIKSSDGLKENVPVSEAVWTPALQFPQSIKNATLESGQYLGTMMKSTTNAPFNALTRRLFPSADGDRNGDVPKTAQSIKTKDTPESDAIAKSMETEELDIGEVLRAFWIEDAVFHRRLAVSVIDVP